VLRIGGKQALVAFEFIMAAAVVFNNVLENVLGFAQDLRNAVIAQGVELDSIQATTYYYCSVVRSYLWGLIKSSGL